MIKKALFFTAALCLAALTGCGSSNNGKVVELNDENFDDNVGELKTEEKTFEFSGSTPKLVVFTSSECNSCKKMEENAAKLAQKYGSQVDVYKIDISKAPKTEEKYGAHGLPWLLFIEPNSQQVSNSLGYVEYDELQKLAEQKFGF